MLAPAAFAFRVPPAASELPKPAKTGAKKGAKKKAGAKAGKAAALAKAKAAHAASDPLMFPRVRALKLFV